MVDSITTKVKSFERILPSRNNTSNGSILVPISPEDSTIRVVSTYGIDQDLLDIIEKYEPSIESSPSFTSSSSRSRTTSNTDTSSVPGPAQNNKFKLISYVKRTGSSLRKKLVNPRMHAESSRLTKTEPCGNRNCKCCPMISPSSEHLISGVKVKPAPGTCSTYNIVDIFVCRLCSKCYVGRTVRTLHERVSEHRSKFYKLLSDPSIRFSDDFLSEESDVYSLGNHLIEHHFLSDKADFGATYEVFILINSSPSNLEVNEHKFIQKLRTLKPHGINSCDPFGIPLLFENKTFGLDTTQFFFYILKFYIV